MKGVFGASLRGEPSLGAELRAAAPQATRGAHGSHTVLMAATRVLMATESLQAARPAPIVRSMTGFHNESVIIPGLGA
jgi:hypothetical protein